MKKVMHIKLLTFKDIYSQYTADYQVSHSKPGSSLYTAQLPLVCVEEGDINTFKIIFIKVAFSFFFEYFDSG